MMFVCMYLLVVENDKTCNTCDITRGTQCKGMAKGASGHKEPVYGNNRRAKT